MKRQENPIPDDIKEIFDDKPHRIYADPFRNKWYLDLGERCQTSDEEFEKWILKLEDAPDEEKRETPCDK